VGMKWGRKRNAGVSSRMVRSGMATCCCGGDCWMSSGGWVVGRRWGSAAPGGVAVDGGVGDDVLLWLWVRLGCGLPLPRFALPPWRAVRLLVYLYATRPCTTLSPSEERSALASWFELQRHRRMVAERTKKGTGIVGRLACPTVGPADGWWSRGFGCRPARTEVDATNELETAKAGEACHFFFSPIACRFDSFAATTANQRRHATTRRRRGCIRSRSYAGTVVRKFCRN
jgi:hypothetical protein